MNTFLRPKTQRWDDHRFYHQSRINQSLHFVSALSFLVSYVLVFINLAWAALLAWGVSDDDPPSRPLFFELRGFDHVNNVTDEYKEEIKVGYNIQRKIVLMAVWWPARGAVAHALIVRHHPARATDLRGYVEDVGMAWFCLGVVGLLLRVSCSCG